MTEPEAGTALHGLVCWQEWRVAGAGPDRVTLATEIWPQPGYPFRIGLATDYQLGPDGLSAVSYTPLRAHETLLDLVCRLPLEKKNNTIFVTPSLTDTYTYINNTILCYIDVQYTQWLCTSFHSS